MNTSKRLDTNIILQNLTDWHIGGITRLQSNQAHFAAWHQGMGIIKQFIADAETWKRFYKYFLIFLYWN